MSGRRANGSGTVYRRGDRWAAKYPKVPSGFHYVPGTFRLKSEAQTALRQLADRVENGQPATDSAVTFTAYCDGWITGTLMDSPDRWAPNTVAQYSNLLRNHAMPVLGRLPLRDIRGRHLDSLKAKATKAGMASSSVRSLMYALKALFATAVRDGLVAVSPMVGVSIPVARSVEPTVLDPEGLASLIEACADDPLGPLVLFLILTGTRRGEALGLTWTALDLDAGVARIEVNRTRVHGYGIVTGPTKTRTNRVVGLPPVLVARLRRLRAEQATNRLAAGEAWADTGLVFVGKLGNGLDPRGVTRKIRVLLEAHGMAGANLGPHLLRHSTISMLLSEGQSAPAVSKLAGHSSTRVTLTTYAHALRKDEAAITSSLGRLAGTGS